MLVQIGIITHTPTAMEQHMSYLVVCEYKGKGNVGNPVNLYRERDKNLLTVDYPGAVDYDGDDEAVVGGWVYFQLDVES